MAQGWDIVMKGMVMRHDTGKRRYGTAGRRHHRHNLVAIGILGEHGHTSQHLYFRCHVLTTTRRTNLDDGSLALGKRCSGPRPLGVEVNRNEGSRRRTGRGWFCLPSRRGLNRPDFHCVYNFGNRGIHQNRRTGGAGRFAGRCPWLCFCFFPFLFWNCAMG